MLRLAWLVFFAVGPSWNLYAIDDFQLSADSIGNDMFQAHQVVVAVHGLETQAPAVNITATTITSIYSEGLHSIRLECQLTVRDNEQFHCADGLLSYIYPDGTAIKTTLSFDYNLDRDWRLSLRGLDIDLAYIAGILHDLHPALQNYQLSAGRLRGEVELRGKDGSVDAIKLNSQVQGLSLAGTSTLEKVTADIDLDIVKENGVWSTRADCAVSAGSMYIVPGLELLDDNPGFFIEVGAEPLSLQLTALWDTDKNWLILREFNYIHPQILELRGNAEMIMSEEITLPVVSLYSRIDKLENTFPIYIQPLLLNTNFSNLEIAGGMALAVDYHDRKLEHLDLSFNGIYIDDANDRFSLSGLNGNLSIRGDAEPVQSSLSWDGMSFHRLDFGKGSVVFASVAGQVDVLRWDDLAVLDGKLVISSFNMKNIGAPDFELTVGARLTPVSMNAFSQAMQWPLLSGTLSGTFPGLKYSLNNLQFNGDINIQVFAGDVVVRNLLIEDLFSEYSRLSADIAFNGLDLEQLTDTFTFGKIAGTLNGELNNLMLENWQPVYFEAAFITPEKDDRPHRISRKALDNLNSLGGGLSGTMSRGA
ncbi:MAG: hypothetical protein HW386_1976, partial [Gammaproteobacteria bacterium]|nr:hypothetical protein [Gammaproteobacteria bacterium]